jgi:hypothetical protein
VPPALTLVYELQLLHFCGRGLGGNVRIVLEGGGIHLLGNLGIEGILLQLLILPEMSDVFVLSTRTFLICRFSLLFMLHR